MKICRIKHGSFDGTRYGLIDGSTVRLLDESKLFGEISVFNSAESFSLEQVDLVSPVAPTKIVCVGRNYREHAAELGNKMPDEPLLFFKPPSAVISPGDRVELPPQ